jgi:hypothetical protein
MTEEAVLSKSAAYSRKWRAENRDLARERARKHGAARYAEKRIWIASLKSAVGCQSCGERFHGALDFHHKDPDKGQHYAHQVERWRLSMDARGRGSRVRGVG